MCKGYAIDSSLHSLFQGFNDHACFGGLDGMSYKMTFDIFELQVPMSMQLMIVSQEEVSVEVVE